MAAKISLWDFLTRSCLLKIMMMWKMFKEFYQEMYSRAQYVNISYMLLLAAPLASEGSVFEEWMGRK